jgi:uncharacterized membrane protein
MPGAKKKKTANQMLKDKMKKGKVTEGNINKVRDKIAKKTGNYPMGRTN